MKVSLLAAMLTTLGSTEARTEQEIKAELTTVNGSIAWLTDIEATLARNYKLAKEVILPKYQNSARQYATLTLEVAGTTAGKNVETKQPHVKGQWAVASSSLEGAMIRGDMMCGVSGGKVMCRKGEEWIRTGIDGVHAFPVPYRGALVTKSDGATVYYPDVTNAQRYSVFPEHGHGAGKMSFDGDMIVYTSGGRCYGDHWNPSVSTTTVEWKPLFDGVLDCVPDGLGNVVLLKNDHTVHRSTAIAGANPTFESLVPGTFKSIDYDGIYFCGTTMNDNVEYAYALGLEDTTMSKKFAVDSAKFLEVSVRDPYKP